MHERALAFVTAKHWIEIADFLQPRFAADRFNDCELVAGIVILPVRVLSDLNLMLGVFVHVSLLRLPRVPSLHFHCGPSKRLQRHIARS